MTGDEYSKRLEQLTDTELLIVAADWIGDSLSAHYECSGDAPGEIAGRRILAELHRRASRTGSR